MATIVSGFSPAGYEQYGRNFVETFDKYWPEDVKLVLYVEEPFPNCLDRTCRPSPRVEQRSLWDCPGQKDFIERHKDNPKAHGREPTPQWGKREYRHFERNGWTYRFDAVRFSRQLFIPEHALSCVAPGEVMAWMDSDVVTFDGPPKGFIESLLGHHDLVSLGRDGANTELGFWAIRRNDGTERFVHRMAEACRTDSIFDLNEWHSGFVFDHFLSTSGLHKKNLTTSGRGHVWFQCELGKYTDHLKGEKRKEWGYSRERWGVMAQIQARHEADKAEEQKHV